MSTFLLIFIAYFSIIILILIYRFLFKGEFYLTSYQVNDREFILNEPDQLNGIVFKSLKESNFKKVSEENDQFSAITLPTISSFSELIKVDIIKIDGNKYKLKFISKCFFPLQIFDWGKNQRNSEIFFKNVEKMIIRL